MTTSNAGAAGIVDRSIELLPGSDMILADPATSTGSLGNLGAILSAIEAATGVEGGTATGSNASPPTNPVVTLANEAIIDTHLALEGFGHEVPVLNPTIHALTSLGETVGLGHVGQPGNLVTTLVDLPDSVATGGLSGAALVADVVPVLGEAGSIAGATQNLVDQATALATTGLTGAGSPIAPVVGFANAAVLDLHGALESLGHEIPVLNTPLHALTGLGETIGLGHIGSAGNLITSVVGLPAALASGGGIGDIAQPLLTETGSVLGASGTLIDSLTGIATPGSGLIGPGGLLDPATGLANAAILDTHAALETLAGQTGVLGGPVQALAHLGETVGLGHVGEGDNLLTDAITAPSQILGGNAGGALQGIVADAGASLNAAGGLVNSIATGGNAVSLVETVTHALGGSGGSQPLVSVEAGPQSSNPIAAATVLAPADPSPHTVDAGIGTAPAGHAPAAQVGLLSGDAVALPTLGGGSLDALIGQAATPVSAIAGASAATQIPDLGHAPGLEVAGLDIAHLAGAHDPAHPGASHGLI